VLVVDDEPMIATAIGRTLGLDHDVVLASAAATALRRIEQGEQFDVILCDLMMPQMTGMDLYDELVRAWPGQADRMVFLSGGAFTSAARAFLDDVPNRMLEKPFDTRQLLALVNERTRAH
jgi:CheY-like chemotaxis protein